MELHLRLARLIFQPFFIGTRLYLLECSVAFYCILRFGTKITKTSYGKDCKNSFGCVNKYYIDRKITPVRLISKSYVIEKQVNPAYLYQAVVAPEAHICFTLEKLSC